MSIPSSSFRGLVFIFVFSVVFLFVFFVLLFKINVCPVHHTFVSSLLDLTNAFTFLICCLTKISVFEVSWTMEFLFLCSISYLLSLIILSRSSLAPPRLIMLSIAIVSEAAEPFFGVDGDLVMLGFMGVRVVGLADGTFFRGEIGG